MFKLLLLLFTLYLGRKCLSSQRRCSWNLKFPRLFRGSARSTLLKINTDRILVSLLREHGKAHHICRNLCVFTINILLASRNITRGRDPCIPSRQSSLSIHLFSISSRIRKHPGEFLVKFGSLIFRGTQIFRIKEYQMIRRSRPV
jgi:hypothetical protein